MMACGKQEKPLPDGYIRLDYIVNETAGAYIDTGVYANPQYSMEADVMLSWRSSYWPIFGMRDSRGGRFAVRGPASNGSGFSFQYGTSTSYESIEVAPFSIGQVVTKWNVFGLYKNVAKINGITVHTFTANTHTTTYNRTLYLLGTNGTNEVQAQYCRGARIWNESGDLVRDYVPAYEVSSGKYGMYDIVNGTFESSASSVPFTGRISVLPEGHTQLDFITFTGAQAIYFSETVNPDDRFVFRFRFTATTPVQQRVFKTTDTYAFHFYINGSGSLAFNYGATGRWVNISQAANNVYFGNIDFDGSAKRILRYYASTNASTGLSNYTEAGATRFSLGEHGGVYSYMEIMRFEKYTSGVLAHNLVPDLYLGEFGFFDTVTNTFIPSATSTPFSGGYLKNRGRATVIV